MRTDLPKKKMNKEENQKKIESNIKNIDVGSRIKDKEIDSSKINADKNLATVKKLPKSKYGVIKKKEKSRRVREKTEKANENEQSGSGSGSGSDGEEENKGNEGSEQMSSEQ